VKKHKNRPSQKANRKAGQVKNSAAQQGITRRALRSVDDGRFEYLLADVKTEIGLAFATRYGVAHVTLLMFGKDGEMI
jgi:hypothetical protein